jgi:hypothetical protein
MLLIHHDIYFALFETFFSVQINQSCELNTAPYVYFNLIFIDCSAK